MCFRYLKFDSNSNKYVREVGSYIFFKTDKTNSNILQVISNILQVIIYALRSKTVKGGGQTSHSPPFCSKKSLGFE